MASMMHLFRKYQYILLVVFGVLLMVVFVVGDALQRLSSGPGGGPVAADVVLTWKDGSLTDRDLSNLRANHNMTLEFLNGVVTETVRREGTPKGPGVFPDRFGGYTPGITRAQSNEDLVRSMLLAAKAESLGMVIDDDAIFDFLYQLSDNELDKPEFSIVFNKTIGGRTTERHLMDQLRRELLAQQMLMMSRAGLFVVSPREAWELSNRLQRRVQTEMVALNVDEFKAQVTGTPTETQIVALYEEAKDRFGNPNLPEPGFMRRRRISFGYVRADFGKFQEEEIAKVKDEITDEDIEKYYDENKDQFRAIDLPKIGDETKSEMPGDLEAGNKEDTETGEESKKDADGEKSPADETEPPAKKDDSDSKESKQPADSPENGKQNEDSDEPPKPPTGDGDADAKKDPAPDPSSGDDDQGAVIGSADEVFVALSGNDETERADAPPEDDASPDPPENQPAPPEAAGADETDPKPKPAAPTAADDKKPESAEKSKDKKDDTEKEPAEKKQKDPAPSPDEEKPTGSADETVEKKDEPKDEPKYKPLDDELREDIRKRIARDRAREPAQERLDAGFGAVEKAIEKYGRQLRIHEVSPESPEPDPIDVAAIAAEHEMTAGETDLADELEIEEHELGKASTFSIATGSFQQLTFAQIAYFEGLQANRAERIRGAEADTEFLYWKVAEEEAFVPELKDIRDEVIDAWKRQEAFLLAQAEADRLAKAASGDKPLDELIADREELKVITPLPFSWMSPGFTPFGGGGAPSLSQVIGVDAAGTEFMKAVFALEPGEVGVAVNQPHSHVYLVRVVSQMPEEAVLRNQFLSSGVTPEVSQMAMMELERLWQDWYEDLEREMNVAWQ
jgi:hypothetical protein